MGRACRNGLDRAGGGGGGRVAGNSAGACTWTSDNPLGAGRCRGFVENSRRHGCVWFHAGRSDGADLSVVDDRCVTDDEETRGEYGREVFWRCKQMKKLILAIVAIACVSSYAAGQTAKRRAVKTGPPNGIFSPAIITGDLVFTSGQIGIDPKTGQFPEGGIEAQTEQVFRNLAAVLEASGSSVDHILKATVFLADMNDYNTMNELYKKHFKGDPPARSTVQVARLPRDAKIEIEAIAVLK